MKWIDLNEVKKMKRISNQKDLPRFVIRDIDLRRVTYRGTGMDGPCGKLIAHSLIDKEFFITDELFAELGGIIKMRFNAPYRDDN